MIGGRLSLVPHIHTHAHTEIHTHSKKQGSPLNPLVYMYLHIALCRERRMNGGMREEEEGGDEEKA